METRVERALDRFVAALREALGADLRSVVLYGSGAEDALRPTSDVNVIVVLAAFRPEALATVRDEVLLAGAAVRLRPMFLLEGEIRDAAEAFAVKFEDLRRRRRVLYGPDPFAALAVPRAAALARIRQVLLNLALRLRERFVAVGDRDEDLALVASDAAGPLRACAAEILSLEGRPAPSPREALQQVAGEPMAALSEAREKRPLPPGEAARLVLRLIALAEAMRERAAGVT